MSAFEAVTESDLMESIMQYAELKGWAYMHAYDSRRVKCYHPDMPEAKGGFPDLMLIRDNRLLFVEVKAEWGRLTVRQERWADSIRKAQIECAIVRPSNWDEFRKVLD